MRKRLKATLEGNRWLRRAMFGLVNRLPGVNSVSVRGRGSRVLGFSDTLVLGCRITIRGANNRLIFGSMSRLRSCTIAVYGNDNIVDLGDRLYAQECEFHVEDDGNRLTVGQETAFCGRSHFAVTEGTSLAIGEGCLASSDVTIRTGDSHAIWDGATGERVNEASDVVVGEHVWLGNHTIVLKGATLGRGSVVASGAVVTAGIYGDGSIIGGTPARVLRQGVSWTKARSKRTVTT